MKKKICFYSQVATRIFFKDEEGKMYSWNADMRMGSVFWDFFEITAINKNDIKRDHNEFEFDYSGIYESSLKKSLMRFLDLIKEH